MNPVRSCLTGAFLPLLLLCSCAKQEGKLAGGMNAASGGAISGQGSGGNSGAAGAGSSSSGGETGQAGSSGGGEPLVSTCTIPEPPDLDLEARVIGDGTPESCDNAAIQAATTLGGHVTFDCGPEPITIPISETIMVDDHSIIDGEGMVTLDGGGNTRILWVSNWLQVEIRGLTFTRGSALGAEPIASGGAIRGGWGGELYVKDCVFTDNVAGEVGKEGGGGISAPVNTNNTVVNCHFENNYAGTGPALHGIGSGWNIIDSVFVNNECTTDGGGAVYTDGATQSSTDEIGGLISLCGCRFNDNTARRQGGAAYLWAYHLDTVRVSQCVFENNQVLFNEDGWASGGAIRIGDATLELDRSLFVNNHADRIGGAVWVNGNYPSYISNSTFIGNSAGVEGVTTGGRGGAISGSNLFMTNLTLDSNWGQNMSGAIYNGEEGSELHNSIVVNNYSKHAAGAFQVCRYPLDGANNLQWPEPDSEAPCTENSIFSDPLLVELSDNGGPTATMALQDASPAINQGADCPESDQRGEARAAVCDLGAYEVVD